MQARGVIEVSQKKERSCTGLKIIGWKASNLPTYYFIY
jgi:hypothetical protein